MDSLILVINPGSTSTKLAVFRNRKEVCRQEIRHDPDGLEKFGSVAGQAGLRLGLVRSFLQGNQVNITGLNAVIGRGGLLKPVSGGVYGVNDTMLDELRSAARGEHASNLGAILAQGIAQEAGCPAFIADPVVVDELEDAARVTGIAQIERKSIFHALNQRSAAREAAVDVRKKYEECNLIVAHLGGGISVGAHRKGRVVDVNNALDGDGPLAPERAGTVPAGQLAELCFSGTYTLEQVKKMLTGNGGIAGHTGTSNMQDLADARKGGDGTAALLLEALALRISQEIAKHSATLQGDIDRIILTGGLARDGELVAAVRSRIEHLAPVLVIAGEREMEALAENARAVLEGAAEAKEYV